MKTFTYSSNWYWSQLRNVALCGDRVVSGGATLEAQGDFFVMSGPTGRHTLAISATDAQRLHTHWLGFIERTKAATKGAK